MLLITADHGNAEPMLEPDGTSPHTAHTSNPVPLVVTDPAANLRDGGELKDLVPTAFLPDLSKPLQMRGKISASDRFPVYTRPPCPWPSLIPASFAKRSAATSEPSP